MEQNYIKVVWLYGCIFLQITQISKILNAHMNSLQWIDQNSGKLALNKDAAFNLCNFIVPRS